MSFEQFVSEYGYWAILLWTFIEGETVVIVAGFFAHQGLLDISFVMLTALVGSFSGDQLYYYIGRHGGARLIAKRKSWQVGAARVYKILDRHQYFLILTFRFYYGIRNITPFAIGAAQIPRRRFFILNLIGAIIWAALFSSGGYFLGETLRVFIEDYHRYALYVVAGLLVMAMIFWGIKKLCQRRFVDQTELSSVPTPNTKHNGPDRDAH
jgi:membrane protein DedA with SNARE-associated domain